MEHHHHHHDHSNKIESLNSVFIISIVLNLLFVAVEAAVGLWGNSLGLLSDAGHNLGDVFSLLLAMFAFKLAAVHSNRKYTYGYKKSTILISLVNALILVAAVVAIFVESIRKFRNPEPVNGDMVIWTAVIGIAVNGLTAFLLMKRQKGDLNVRGAFMHMVADTLVSFGVVVSGIVIKYTGLYFIDPIVGIVISVVILVSTWNLLSESIRLSLDGVPANIDIEDLKSEMESVPNVSGVHHLHVWAISTSDSALTAHVVINSMNDMKRIKDEIKSRIAEKGITHATLEFEEVGEVCVNNDCC